MCVKPKTNKHRMVVVRLPLELQPPLLMMGDAFEVFRLAGVVDVNIRSMGIGNTSFGDQEEI